MSGGVIKAEPAQLRTLAGELDRIGEDLVGLGQRAATTVNPAIGPGAGDAMAAALFFAMATRRHSRDLHAESRGIGVRATMFEAADGGAAAGIGGALGALIAELIRRLRGKRTPLRPMPMPWPLPGRPVLPPGFLDGIPRPKAPSGSGGSGSGGKAPAQPPKPGGGGAPLPTPPSGDLGSRIVAIAGAEVGKGEDGRPDQGADIAPYHAATGVGGAWCASFVTWTLHQAGVQMPPANWAHVNAYVQDARAPGGRFQEIPADQVRPGDLVVTDWERNGSFDHIGITTSAVEGGSFRGIDGNWGLGAEGTQKVAHSQQSVSSAGRVFIRVIP